MRILHVTPDYYPAMGGAELHIREFSERLAFRGHDVTVLSLNSGRRPGGANGITSHEVINRVRVFRLNNAYISHDRLFRVRGTHRLLRLCFTSAISQMLATSPFSLRALMFTLRSGADVVAVMNWYHGSLAAQACVARRLRHFSLVGIPLLHTEREWTNSSLLMRMLARCDAVAVNTEHEKQFIEQRTASRNVHVTGVGIEPSQFATASAADIRDQYKLADAPIVGFVGRMVESKGVVALIEAMKHVWYGRPDARLVLAGSPLPPSPGCDGLVEAALMRLSEVERSRIICLSRFDERDKVSIYRTLDVFAMPSVAESFGIAYLEAWMCGKAVIGARIASTACVIDDGIDGFLVPPENPTLLADAVLALLNDSALRERMGRAGRAKTLSRFTWEAATDRIERIYAAAHANRGLRRPSRPSRDDRLRPGVSVPVPAVDAGRDIRASLEPDR